MTLFTRADLREYQKRGVSFIKQREGSGLFVDMGLGKTITALTAARDWIAAGTATRGLIVAPPRVAATVWGAEAARWSHTQHLTFTQITGTEVQRLKKLDHATDIHLISTDLFGWLLRVLASRKTPWPYDFLIVDESSAFKRAGTRRFTSARHHVKKFKRRVILTGTPRPLGYLDLWSQMFFVDEGARLGTSVGRYKAQYFTPAGFRGYGLALDAGAGEAITEAIGDVVLSLRAEDWLDLPPTVRSEVYVDLPPKVRAVYDRLEREMFLQFDAGEVVAANAGVLTGKCHQVANGFLYLDTPGVIAKTLQFLHSEKLEALKSLTENATGPMLVAYWFKEDLSVLQKAYPKAPVVAALKGAALVKFNAQWDRGEHPVALVHPQSAGHGLNFAAGGNIITFYSMLWGPEFYAQVIERIGAARQVNTGRGFVAVNHILARDTVDVAMLEAQTRRAGESNSFSKALSIYRAGKTERWG